MSANTGGGGFSGWDCPFCTYINKQSSFKCAMCGASRGTSTRQARLQPQMVDFFSIGEGQSTAKSSTTGPSSRSTNSTAQAPQRPSKSSSPSTSRSPSPLPVTANTVPQQTSSKQTGSQKQKSKLQSAASSSSLGKGVGSKGKVRSSRLKVLSQWPQVPNIDYHSGLTMEVRYAGETAAITEYQMKT